MKNTSPLFFFVIIVILFLFAAGCTSQSSQEIPGDTLQPNLTIPSSMPPTTIPTILSHETQEFFTYGNTTHIVAKGDRFNITGTVGNKTVSGIIVWVFGKNTTRSSTVPVMPDGTFQYEIRPETTHNMENGLYIIVIQHPGDNGIFDILPEITNASDTKQRCIGFSKPGLTKGPRDNSEFFGSNCIAGYADTAFFRMMDDPTIDGRYKIDEVSLEDPWIRINPIGTIHAGEPFNITGTTNLAEGDELLVTIYPDWYTPMKCGCTISPYIRLMLDKSGEVSDTIVVRKGTGTINTWAFDSDGQTLGRYEFQLNVEAILQNAGNGTTFRVAS